MPNKTKVKVGKWIDTPELDRYERFVSDWHYFLEDVQRQLGQERMETADDERAKRTNLLLLKLFFVRPYEKADFYAQFEERLAFAKEALGLA